VEGRNSKLETRNQKLEIGKEKLEREKSKDKLETRRQKLERGKGKTSTPELRSRKVKSPGRKSATWGTGSRCTYKYIDIARPNKYAKFLALPCDLHGTKTRTARTFANMTCGLRLPFSFSMIPTPLRDETKTPAMRNVG